MTVMYTNIQQNLYTLFSPFIQQTSHQNTL